MGSCPHFIKRLRCGNDPEFEDKAPVETAVVAALLSSLEENMIAMNATSNNIAKLSILHSSRDTYATFSFGGSASGIMNAMKVVKKSINEKLVKRAYTLLITKNPELKKQKEDIMSQIGHILNRPLSAIVYGKKEMTGENKKKMQALVNKVADVEIKTV